MSIETDVRAALLASVGVTALVSQRVYEDFAPDNTPPPYVVFQTITATRTNTLTSGAGRLRNARMQFDCWALQKSTAQAIGDAVTASLVDATGLQCVLNSDAGIPDHETKLRRITLDFSIWKRDP